MTEHNFQETARKWSPLFWVAFCYNLFGATSPLFMPSFFCKQFFLIVPKQLTVISQLHIHFAWISVLFFGIGYAIVAINPAENRGILWLAMFGKLYIGILFLFYWMKGHLQFAAMVGGLGDILFAFLFFFFLYDQRRIL